ncbi:DUF4347 domain-containing protein [Calothrix sp. NIES-2098]|uniref:DUF4347 domain-containing protein n=1 Tax=Calothrix sp. NIES-2098 TaxID=1954171 RepID=UPI000B5FC8C9|nr:outer membrane secretion protein [Calothrix sp. NIES-2098]
MKVVEKANSQTPTYLADVVQLQIKDIVFIDKSVIDYQSLIVGIKPGYEVVILDSIKDGVVQITESLTAGKFQSVHIVCHGSEGSLQIGATQLNRDNLNFYAKQLQQWANVLTNDAEILLYSCDVASKEGTKFVQQISRLTGANVAASTNKIGSAALGGNWDLDFSTGEIKASLAFQPEVMQAYNSVLANPGDVIINEFSQGSNGTKEWVEILVVTDNLDLQNHKLTDSNGSLDITLTGSGFSSLKAGTLIVLYNGADVDATITPDLTYNPTSGDYVLQISSLNNTGLFAVTRNTGWNSTTGAFDNASSTDIPRLINNSSTVIHKLPRNTPAGPTLSLPVGRASAYLSDTASGAEVATNWSADFVSAGANPGLANGGFNTTWINSLRVNSAPILDITGNSTLPTIYQNIPNTSNSGILVADLIKNRISDINNNTQGIAVTELTGNGTWQYSNDGGTSWTNFGSVSNNSATLLTGLVPLYNSSLGSTPNTQGWLQFGASPALGSSVPLGGTQSIVQTTTGYETKLVSTQFGGAGYSNYNAGLPIQLNPALPVLDANKGFTVSFDLKINSESHSQDDNNDGIQDRAGFSVIVVTSDNTKAIELGFWGDQIWAQNDGPNVAPGSTRTLFTHSATESASYDTMSTLSHYDLTIKGDTYSLFAAGGKVPILTGILRNYTAFDHTSAGPLGTSLPYDPYERTNFIFLGDNTTAAQADVNLKNITLETNNRVRFVPATDSNGTAGIKFRGWDGTDGLASGTAGVNTAVGGGTTPFSTDVETAGITINPVNIFTGTSANEAFVATTKTDIFDGKDGLDRVSANIANLQQNDTINGGAGIDTFILSGSSANILTIDLSNSSNQLQGIPGLLVSNFENFDLRTFAGTINSIGSTGNDLILGGVGADSLSGGEGNDNLQGGDGNDTLTGGAGNDNLQGGNGNDTLTGGAGNDILDGGTGNDRLVGGDGDDIYYIDSASDIVDENATTGKDTVYAAITYSLVGKNLENLILTGTAAIDATGNELNNTIKGNNADNSLLAGEGDNLVYGLGGNDSLASGAGKDNLQGGDGNDTLTAGAGNDILDGGTGNDSLVGGDGDDTYYIDSASDIVDENATTGKDTVYAAVTYSFVGKNLENLILTGTAAIDATGNELNNTIKGNNADNSLLAGDGDNLVYGLGGNDSLSSGVGKDSLYGGDGNDTLTAGAGNDILDGGTGNDSLVGGDGDDIYYIDSASDIVDENATTGKDTVYAAITYSFVGKNLENLILTGTAAIDATGNELNNTIKGNNADNSLLAGDGDNLVYGLGGNDSLASGVGKDNLQGGDGNDTLSAGAGNDILDGGTGNDSLVGGDGNDSLLGGNDNDVLVGGAGNDYLLSGTGNDQLVYNLNSAFNSGAIGVDTIADFTLNSDKIVLYKNTFTALTSIAGNGFSVANEFIQVTTDAAAAISSATIVYNSANGKLFYNENGVLDGFGTGAQFATFTNSPSLSANDFLIQ